MNAATSAPAQKFGRLRSLFCPVQKSEFKLFIPLLLIFFFICFNYNILRPAKESLVVTAPGAGAEILPFLKVWAVLPMALAMSLLFTKLANRFSIEKVFYIMMSIFVGFFVLFATVLYPLREYIHPYAWANSMEAVLPLGLKGLIAIIRHWSYALFYVMAELWNVSIMTVLFWGFANEVLNVGVAKRFYVLILLGGNQSAIAAGGAIAFMSKMGLKWGAKLGTDPWQISLLILTFFTLFSSGAAMIILRWLHKNVLHKREIHIEAKEKETKEEYQLGLRKNFQYLAKSRYLLLIATLVVAYNICINLTEVTWKSQLGQIHTDPSHFQAYMGKVTLWVGIIATFISILSATLLRQFSWTVNALIPPIILVITGAGFFSFLLCKNSTLGMALAGFLGSTPLVLGTFFGSLQNCFSRASKYTIFDATKELVFIPLSRESKLKGKAAIDGVGSRLGKSGSSLLYQALLLSLGTVDMTLPYVALIFLIVTVLWIVAVCSLGKEFNLLVEKQEKEQILKKQVLEKEEMEPVTSTSSSEALV